jgi:hypothetical protein
MGDAVRNVGDDHAGDAGHERRDSPGGDWELGIVSPELHRGKLAAEGAVN